MSAKIAINGIRMHARTYQIRTLDLRRGNPKQDGLNNSAIAAVH